MDLNLLLRVEHDGTTSFDEDTSGLKAVSLQVFVLQQVLQHTSRQQTDPRRKQEYINNIVEDLMS